MKVQHLYSGLLGLILSFGLGLNQVAIADEESLSDKETPRKRYIQACKGFRKSLAKMDLSDTQRDDISVLLTEYREGTEALRSQIVDAKKNLAATVFTPTEEFDPDIVRTDHKALSALREDLVVEYAEALSEAQTILTDEQYQLYVRSRAQLYVCSNAPRRFYQRIVNKWLEKN